MINDELRRKLRWVNVSESSAGRLDRFPNFLIVGPQRTGTTWLHAHLRFHPQIFLSEPKEIFFFSSLKTPDSPRYRSNELDWYLQFFRDPPWRAALKMSMCLWKFRELYRPRVRGEATASYAALDRDVIEEIYCLRPDIRVILMIRNPVERAWSHAKKDLVRNRRRRFADVSDEEFREFFASDYQRRCANYTECYDNWAEILGAGSVFVGKFDDITERPDRLLLDVMAFLGVSSSQRYIASDVNEPVNRTGSDRIPEKHRQFLTDLLGQELVNLRERFGLSWNK